jgi:hypothetical protein
MLAETKVFISIRTKTYKVKDIPHGVWFLISGYPHIVLKEDASIVKNSKGLIPCINIMNAYIEYFNPEQEVIVCKESNINISQDNT